MNEESEYWADLRQEVARYQAANRKIRGEAKLEPDPEWQVASDEFDRQRRLGVAEQEAVEVFRPFLNDPARRDAAALLLECFGAFVPEEATTEQATTEEASG